ncbi:DUF808 domain-containing protein [Nitratifractor sp.]
MASGFFALFDDIASLMDDIALTAKTAGKQTAGVLGDDLAVNADKAAGFASSRELPVLWAIAKGSLLNKLLILPAAFLLGAFAPWAITPILMAGGLYLAYEGAEKVLEWMGWHSAHEEEAPEPMDEAAKIRSAIRTDFILSIEIVIIALGAVEAQPLAVQIPVVALVALAATVGVYGIVALIVRLDDMGYGLIRWDLKDGQEEWLSRLGRAMVAALPWIVRALGYVGTVAMLLVAGGIWVHHLPWLEGMIHPLPALLGELLVGFSLGAAVVALTAGAKALSGMIRR